jgi:hypothetical protein
MYRYDVGWYKYQAKALECEKLVKAAEEAGNEEVERLITEYEKVVTAATEMKGFHDQMMKAVLKVHNKPNDPLMAAPTGTTPADFLRFMGLVLPVRQWPDHPMDNRAINAAQRILHPDKQQESANPLSVGIIKKDTMLEWHQVFEQSVQQTKDWWNNASDVKRQEFMDCWQQEKQDILSCLDPLGSPILWFTIQEQARGHLQ